VNSEGRLTVYLAAGVDTYTTPSYDAARAQLQAHWPRARVISPREQYTCTADWLRQWSSIAPSVDALVILPYPDGTTGLGVYTEADAVRRQGGAVYVIDAGHLYPLARLDRLTAGRTHALTQEQRVRFAHCVVHAPHGPTPAPRESPATR
jgi:hypothetical protein